MNEHLIMGIVQEDGSFSLVCGPHGAGAPPGEYDVLIEWKQDRNQPKGLAAGAHDRLRGRYADPKSPRLHATVNAETNSLPPFELNVLTHCGHRLEEMILRAYLSSDRFSTMSCKMTPASPSQRAARAVMVHVEEAADLGFIGLGR